MPFSFQFIQEFVKVTDANGFKFFLKNFKRIQALKECFKVVFFFKEALLIQIKKIFFQFSSCKTFQKADLNSEDQEKTQQQWNLHLRFPSKIPI